MVPSVMLAVHAKKSDALDLSGPITAYVRDHYSQQQASDARDDLDAVSQMRNTIVTSAGSLTSLRSTLAKYYRALSLMEARFPVSRAADHIDLSFGWYDAFRPTKKAEQASIHFEKAAIVFNLGAVQSQMALASDRKSGEGLKESAKLFQEAAGTFAFLRDAACLKVEAPRPLDLTPECAGMLERLMLAQAQECVYEKAVMDKKSAALIARLAKQVSLFYEDVRRLLSAFPLNQHFDKSWLAHVTVKGLLYEVESMAQAATAVRAAEEVSGCAQEIARLKSAQLVLLAARKEAKLASKELADTVIHREETVTRALAKAERENSTVYLQRIPNVDDLPPVLPAPLVKSVPPSDLTALDEGGLFSSVIPDTSAKALSRYTEMVDNVIRKQMDKLETASDEARLKLRQWELPEALEVLNVMSPAALPDALRNELELIEGSGGVKYLGEVSTQVKELRRVAIEELDRCEEALTAEAKEDTELCSHYGSRWTRQPSASLNKTMFDRAAGYRSNLAVAAQSDARMEARLSADAPAFAALSVEAAAAAMPRLQAPMLALDHMEPATVVASLRSALEALSHLSAQRASLEEALKEQKSKDNVLPKLLASSDHSEALFGEELKKYDALVAEVDANLAKQAQVLRVIERDQAAFKQAYGYQDWRKACEAAARGIRAQAAKYMEIRDNLGEGLRFYMSLQEAIGTLSQQVGDWCLTRRIQRDDLIEDFRRQAEDQAVAERLATQRHLAGMSLGQGGTHRQGGSALPPSSYPPPYGSGYGPAPASASGTPSQHPQNAQAYPQQQAQDGHLPEYSGQAQYAGPPYGAPPQPPSAYPQTFAAQQPHPTSFYSSFGAAPQQPAHGSTQPSPQQNPLWHQNAAGDPTQR